MKYCTKIHNRFLILVIYLVSNQEGVSGRANTNIAGSKGMKAPGRHDSLQGKSQPKMYMRRLPVFAAAGIRIVSVPLSSGVDISRK